MKAGRRMGIAALGLAAGFLSAFLGIGGGLVIVPVLMAAFHQPIKRAVGTSLLAIIPVSAIGVLVEMLVKGENIHWRMAAVLTVGALAGAWAGAAIIARIPETPLRLVYAAFLGFSAWRLFTPAGAPSGSGLLDTAEQPLFSGALALASGAMAGLSSVLFGVGGGIVTVPALSLLFRDFPFHAARATSLVTIVPTSIWSAWHHRRMKTVDGALALGLVPTGVLGAVAGVITVNRLPPGPCRLAFAVFLILAMARILTLKEGGTSP